MWIPPFIYGLLLGRVAFGQGISCYGGFGKLFAVFQILGC